jgi:hypothetical protein
MGNAEREQKCSVGPTPMVSNLLHHNENKTELRKESRDSILRYRQFGNS